MSEQFISGWNAAVDRYSKPSDFLDKETSDYREGVESVWEFVKFHNMPIYVLQDEKLYL